MRRKGRRPTRRRSWHGPASARRPSRLGTSKPHGVTRRAFARLKCGAPRAALASARGPWPCSLASDPLGRPDLYGFTFLPPTPADRPMTYPTRYLSPNAGGCADRLDVCRSIPASHAPLWQCPVVSEVFTAEVGFSSEGALLY